ncbi:MAG: hemerythrin domain-containing protein [gamma proteobacterium symbiont of Taylorina sp.]|nr:hemerythrin domain-containing protein [gamma proteobacterium symbiont of Taylorina sp.]
MISIKQLLKQAPDTIENDTPFERPLELLESCHEKIIHFSSTLLKLSTELKQQGWSEELINTAKNICQYFNIASPEHHLDEEQHLFPAIIALGSKHANGSKSDNKKDRDLIQLINRMIKEHVETDNLWEKINNLLNNRSKDFKQLEKLSLQFKDAMHEHAEIENNIIFPYAKTHISDSEFKKMGAAIASRRGIKV